jgi:predicted TPR repeat methyltransferase
MDLNQQTITAYETFAKQYIDSTPHEIPDFVKELIDSAVADRPKDARILEIGSAFGREAGYLQHLGYLVECSDVVQEFIVLLREKGFEARKLNAITDDLGGPYALVVANAVLLHFTRGQTEQVLRKVLAALHSGGTVAFTLLEGTGDKLAKDKLGAARYFCFWSEEQIRQLLVGAGFKDIQIDKTQTAPWATWLRIVAHVGRA